MRIPGAWSTSLREVLTGRAQPADWLGVCEAALYLRARTGAVLAVVVHDAVRLPCAVVLSTTGRELTLTSLAAADRPPASVGSGYVSWDGPRGRIVLDCARQWAPARVHSCGSCSPGGLATVRETVARRDVGLGLDLVSALTLASSSERQRAAALGLLGRGPGLTPSGDDVLAGFLLGARAFGRDASGVRQIVADRADRATTSLSAQLLRHAADGECCPELAELLTELTRPSGGRAPDGRRAVASAAARLMAVGHSSGAALAFGVLAAAEAAPFRYAERHAQAVDRFTSWRRG
jgi:hypothetical protein